MKPSLPPLALTADVGVLLASGAARAQLLITGNDEKLATIFGLSGSAMSDVGNFVDGDVDHPAGRRRCADEGGEFRATQTSGLDAWQHTITLLSVQTDLTSGSAAGKIAAHAIWGAKC